MTKTSTPKLAYEPPRATLLTLPSLSILVDLSFHGFEFDGFEPDEDF